MRSDFYFIAEIDPLLFSCRLIHKAYQQQHQIYIHTSNENDANKLNEMLWTFQQNSFIAHARVGDYQADFPPVEIGYTDKPNHHQDLLINLSQQPPIFANQFQRVVEIIANTDNDNQRSEMLLTYYQQQQFDIHKHLLRK